jgi:hypothetical protein
MTDGHVTKEMECCAPQATEAPTSFGVGPRLRSWLRSPQGLTIAGIGVIAIGVVLNWSWPVAIGVAPLILSFGPCAAMCALGVCMNIRGHSPPPAVKPGSGPVASGPAPSPAVNSTRE